MKIVKKSLTALAVSALMLGTVSAGTLILSADVVYAKGNDKNDDRGNSGNSSRSDKGNKNKGGSSNSKNASNKSTSGQGGGFFGLFKKKNKQPTQQTASVAPTTTVPTAKPAKAVNRGALASELRGPNATPANPNALKNASPNSMVGKVAAYQIAVNNEPLREALEADLLLKEGDLATLISEYGDGRSSGEIKTDIQSKEAAQALLDPLADAAAYNALSAEIAALNTELSAAEAFEGSTATLTSEIASLGTQIEELGPTPDEALDTATGGRILSPEALAELHRLLGLPDPAEEEPIDDVAVVE